MRPRAADRAHFSLTSDLSIVRKHRRQHAPSRCLAWTTEQDASQASRCSPPAPAPGSAAPSSSTGPGQTQPVALVQAPRLPRNPLINGLPTTHTVATSGFTILGCYNVFSNDLVNRVHGLSVSIVWACSHPVMTRPATYKERFR